VLCSSNIVEPSKDSHDIYVGKLEAEQVRAAIQALPVDFREIILLREYEDLSYQEIASVLDCPVGTVMRPPPRGRWIAGAHQLPTAFVTAAEPPNGRTRERQFSS
jgi:DNA-directed RNA polymerase specialized sigma24 family protein